MRLASVVADLTGSLQGQLLDCGLAKLAPLPTEETGTNDTILGSTTNSSIFSPNGLPFGTPGFLCPRYSKPPYHYSAASEVYSQGMIEPCDLSSWLAPVVRWKRRTKTPNTKTKQK